MNEHQALLQAQDQVRLPKKDQATGDWVVEYRNNGHWVREAFTTDEAAYIYFHFKISEFKAQFMTQDKGQR